MSKIKVGIQGKIRPSLRGLFNTFVTRKMTEGKKKLALYYQIFPFLAQWGVDIEDADSILRYYGYLDKDGNIVLNPDKKKRDSRIITWDEEDYWDEYEEIYPGPKEEDDEENIYSELYPDAESLWGELESEDKKKGKGGKYKHTKGKKNKKKGSEDMLDITKPYTQGFLDETDLPEEEGEDSVAQYIWFYPDYHDKSDKLEFNSLKDFDDFCAKNDFAVPPYVAERIAYRPVSHVCLSPKAKDKGINEIIGEESYGDMFYQASEESREVYCF